MWIDTHAHLDSEEFREDLPAVIERATAAGVVRMLAVATDRASSERCIELANHYSQLSASAGIHPNYAVNAAVDDWDQVIALARHAHIRALGETGLDRHWDTTPFSVQQDYFQRHLDLSRDTSLPVVIHTRECDADVLEQLRRARQQGVLRGVMHSFSGEAATAAEALELGLYVSFAGMVTFKKNDALRVIAASIPDDRLLVETDCPYLAPHPLRGKRNEPAHVVHTGRCLADVRGVSYERLAELTSANAERLFNLRRQ